MDAPQTPVQKSCTTSSCDGIIIPRLQTSRDIRHITFTYYNGLDTYGPHCQKCMNQLFQKTTLDNIPMVYVFTLAGFIPFSIRSLVFMYGMETPFSIKDIGEEFVVMTCTNCSSNFDILDMVTENETEEVCIIRTSISGKKRQFSSPESSEETSSNNREQHVKRMKAEVDEPKREIDEPCKPQATILDADPVSPNSALLTEIPTKSENRPAQTSSRQEMSDSGVATTLNHNFNRAASSGETGDGTWNDIQHLLDVCRADASTMQGDSVVPNLCKESNTICRKRNAGFVKNGSSVLVLSEYPRTAETRVSVQIPGGSGFYSSIDPTKATSDLSQTKLNTNPGYVPLLSITGSTGLPSATNNNCQRPSSSKKCHKSDTFAMKSCTTMIPQNGENKKSSKIKKSIRLEDTANLVVSLLSVATNPSGPSPASVSYLGPTIANRFKDDNDLQALLQDFCYSAVLKEARILSKDGFDIHPLIPFVTGKEQEDPTMTFSELYDGINYLMDFVSSKNRLFAAFMCERFPEILNIKFCNYCGMIPRACGTGDAYVFHFLSFQHIIKAINYGYGFSRDFIALKKCLEDFFIKCELENGIQTLGACIEQKKYSTGGGRQGEYQKLAKRLV